MRETELWERLDKQLGAAYGHVWAAQTVLPELGQTVTEAIAAGVPTKQVWRAVCKILELPPRER